MAILNFLNFVSFRRLARSVATERAHSGHQLRFRLDGRPASTYVKRFAITGPSLQLLLFLSALLSGLTGVISGERVTAPSSLERGSAQVAAVAEELAEVAVRTPAALPAAAAPALASSAPRSAVGVAPSIDPLRFSESRLE